MLLFILMENFWILLPLPKDCKQNSTNIIEFVAERTWMPKHYGFEDSRNFGIAVGEITME